MSAKEPQNPKTQGVDCVFWHGKFNDVTAFFKVFDQEQLQLAELSTLEA